MCAMVRKQFFIDEVQEAKLARLSVKSGLSQAQLVRSALERLIVEMEQVGLRGDWQAVLEVMESRATLSEALEQRPRTWRREEVYDRGPGSDAR